MKPIRILLVDDHIIVRSGLVSLFAMESDIEIVAEAANLAEAIKHIDEDSSITLAVVDLRLPDGSGIDLIRHIAKTNRGTASLTLSVNAGEHDIMEAVRAGADGYLSKSSERSELVDAVRQVAAGGNYFPASIRQKLEAGKERPTLTKREKEILTRVVKGRSNKEIADSLGIADITVRQHVSAILAKLGTEDRTQAAVYALKEGFVSHEEADQIEESQ